MKQGASIRWRKKRLLDGLRSVYEMKEGASMRWRKERLS